MRSASRHRPCLVACLAKAPEDSTPDAIEFRLLADLSLQPPMPEPLPRSLPTGDSRQQRVGIELLGDRLAPEEVARTVGERGVVLEELMKVVQVTRFGALHQGAGLFGPDLHETVDLEAERVPV